MEQRKATYTSAIRMAHLVAMLSQAWRPLSVEQIAQTLNVSARTLYRYRKALNEQLSSSDGKEFLKVIREGKKELWYLSDQEEINSANGFRIISVFVAKSLLKFMEGTVIKDNIDNIWNIVAGQLPPSKKKQLEYFDRKIRCTGFGGKNYEEKDIILAAVLRGLIHQNKIRMLYQSSGIPKGKSRIIHPYTLLLHRDTLYLHAYDEEYREIRTFLVDRIQEASNLSENFRYPLDYNPEALTEGSFGIYDSRSEKPFKVVVSFKAYLWDYITTRSWHPSQKFLSVQDGSFNMELHLSHTTEFIPWVLAFGKEAKVLEPEFLRDTIKNELEQAFMRY